MVLKDFMIEKSIKLSGFEADKISPKVKESVKQAILFSEKITKFENSVETSNNFDVISFNLLRDDIQKKSFARGKILCNAKKTVDGCFAVNKIME